MENDRRKSDLTRDEFKAAMKDALKEWLDGKFAEFGRWSLGAFLALVVGALALFILHENGWRMVVAK
jgi:hypothetical protein